MLGRQLTVCPLQGIQGAQAVPHYPKAISKDIINTNPSISPMVA